MVYLKTFLGMRKRLLVAKAAQMPSFNPGHFWFVNVMSEIEQFKVFGKKLH